MRIKLSWQRDTGEWIANQWRDKGRSPHITLVQYSGGGLYKTFVPMKWSRDTCHGWKWTTMAYDDWNLLRGWRLLGGSLGEIIRWWYGLQNSGWFVMALETGFTFVLVNVNGWGGGGGGRGAERTDGFKQVLPSLPFQHTCGRAIWITTFATNFCYLLGCKL